ncbi:neuropeptide F-like [Bicyclus anynana]|uniref:Neuropeptide F-like n=1 Tax=Bicyclus anynana TaxID=110368 RepID=A0A6J1N7M9_BICAN|nr:neuropeptide F-like [Bicyclus anynana]
MFSKRITVAIAVVVIAMTMTMTMAEAREEGPHDMADALRMLQELDRLYTQAARPRIDRRDVSDGDQLSPGSLDRAVRLIQLQNLDRFYSYHSRPRFGKRSEAFPNWAKDLEKPDIPAWLAYARR